jgi:hypothetical protein
VRRKSGVRSGRVEKLELSWLALDRDFEPAPAGRVQAVEIEQRAPSFREALESAEYLI